MSKSNLKREIASLKENKNALTEVVDALQQVNIVLKTTNSSLEKRNSSLEEENSKLQHEKTVLLEKTSEWELEKSGFDERTCKLQHENTLLLEKISALEREASACQQENSGLKERILALEENTSTWEQDKARMEEVVATLEGEASIWHQEKILLGREISSPENEASMLMKEEAGLQGGNSPYERKPLFERKSFHPFNNLTLLNGAKTGSSRLLPSSSGSMDQNNVKPEIDYVARRFSVRDCRLCKHMSLEYGIPQKSTIHASQAKNRKSLLTESCGHIIGLEIQARSDLLFEHGFCRVCLFRPITENHKEETCKFLARKQKLKCKYCHLRLSVCAEHKEDNLSNLESFKARFSKYGFDFQF